MGAVNGHPVSIRRKQMEASIKYWLVEYRFCLHFTNQCFIVCIRIQKGEEWLSPYRKVKAGGGLWSR